MNQENESEKTLAFEELKLSENATFCQGRVPENARAPEAGENRPAGSEGTWPGKLQSQRFQTLSENPLGRPS